MVCRPSAQRGEGTSIELRMPRSLAIARPCPRVEARERCNSEADRHLRRIERAIELARDVRQPPRECRVVRWRSNLTFVYKRGVTTTTTTRAANGRDLFRVDHARIDR